MSTTRIAALAACLLLVASLVPAAGARPDRSAKPTLRFLGLSPTRVRGTHFAPGERVRVTLRAGTAKRMRKTRASARGSFTVVFGMLKDSDRCSGLVRVDAAGRHGSRAGYKLPSMACPAMTSDRYDPR